MFYGDFVYFRVLMVLNVMMLSLENKKVMVHLVISEERNVLQLQRPSH